MINLVLLALLVGFLIAFVAISFLVDSQPWDYYLLMRGADWFCFAPEHFAFGRDLHIHYPAPFYSTFCLPYRVAEPILRWAWMLAPVFLALWLMRGRAAVLAYPPLGVLLLIGQSSWLLMPPFIVAACQQGQSRIPWWQGALVALGVFKPHVAAPIWIWLAWRWWRQRQWPALAAWVAGVIGLVLPSFILRPNWLFEWLPNGRGFEPVNLASIAQVPVILGGLAYAPGTSGLLGVVSFCLLIGLIVYGLLRWRRGTLALYDWVLLFFFVSPFVNDYDLVVLLPFIARSRRLLLLALTAGILVWLFAMLSGVTSDHYRWSMSVLVTLVLIGERLWVRRRASAVTGLSVDSLPAG